MAKKSRKQSKTSHDVAILMTGNIHIGYKFIGPMSMEEGMKFADEIKEKQDPEMSHAELRIVPLYSLEETRREMRERGHLMSPQWACIPRSN